MVRNSQGIGWLGWLIVLVVVTGVYWGVYSTWLAPTVPGPFSPPYAEDGDFAETDYRGWFADTLRTFDTSLESVAKDNASFPKAPSFSYRTGGAGYTPLGFTMGCTSDPSCPILAFQDAVRGLRLGETITVVLPPERAYGVADPEKIRVRPLLEEVAATEVLNQSEFQSRYSTTPVDGSFVRDTVWGWNTTVHVSGTIVTIRHSPSVGQVVTVAGQWRAQVVSIDDAADEGRGVIRVRHLLTSLDVNGFVAQDREGNFQIVALDPVAETFTVDYNNAVVGKTLVFQITLASLRKGNR